MENTAIACNLTDEEYRARRKLARKTILPRVVNYKRDNDGLNLQFTNTPKTLCEVKNFIELEQGCCGFLKFALSPETSTPNKLIALKITGPKGATKFIDLFTQLMEEEANVDGTA